MPLPKLTPRDQQTLDTVILKLQTAKVASNPFSAWYILTECRNELNAMADLLVARNE